MITRRLDNAAVGIWLALWICCVVAAGCGADAAGSADSQPGGGGSPVEEQLLEAQGHLAKHDVEQAQSTYAGIISEYQNDHVGAAHAGKALTDLLLLAGSQPTTNLLVDHLGAHSGLDAGQALYAEEGYLYWLSRGVPWHDDGSYTGIRNLISEDLPWPQESLEAAEAFFTGLNTPGDDLMDELVLLADATAQIEAELDLALADPDFEWIYVPGRLFHAEQLDLIVGRSELEFVSSLLAAGRGAVYFVAAYQHDWTLDEALGSQSWIEEPREGWTSGDYALSYFDSRIGREVSHPDRLSSARDAFETSLSRFSDAIVDGLDYSDETTLGWRNANPAYAEELIDFLDALRGSLRGPTELPGSTPTTTIDLSSFFEEGRTLDPDFAWFEPRRTDTELGDESHEGLGPWQVTDRATQQFFIDGVFEPGFEAADGGPQLDIGDERAQDFQHALSGDLENDLEDAYFTTH